MLNICKKSIACRFFYLAGFLISSHSICAMDDPFAAFEKLAPGIIGRMNDIVSHIRPGDDDLILLEKVGEDITPDSFPLVTIPEGTSPDDCVKTLYQIFMNNSRALTVVDPETDPMGGAVVRILKEGINTIAAIKLYEIEDDEFIDPLYECFSTLYIKSIIDRMATRSTLFKFVDLRLAGVYKQGSRSNFFMIFDGASGQSIDTLCSVEAIMSLEENSGLLMHALEKTASAFAQLHQVTSGTFTKREKIIAISHSYTNASVALNRHLLQSPSPKGDDDASISKIFREIFPRVQSFKDRIAAEDASEGMAYDRALSLAHGDAHRGNIFFDQESGDVTFIDYETALRSFRHDADPLKDVGCFLGSIWLKIAVLDEDPDHLYGVANNLRNRFTVKYLEQKLEGAENLEKALERIKFYMWARMFYSDEISGLSQSTMERVKNFLNKEFPEKL